MRLDRPGRDAALLRPNGDGWLLQGAAAFDHEDGPAAVAYQVEVDARRETKRGVITGFLGDQKIQHEIRRDGHGWRLNGAAVEGLGFLGAAVDASANAGGEGDRDISAATGRVTTLVVKAREDVEIARQTRRVLQAGRRP